MFRWREGYETWLVFCFGPIYRVFFPLEQGQSPFVIAMIPVEVPACTLTFQCELETCRSRLDKSDATVRNVKGSLAEAEGRAPH